MPVHAAENGVEYFTRAVFLQPNVVKKQPGSLWLGGEKRASTKFESSFQPIPQPRAGAPKDFAEMAAGVNTTSMLAIMWKV